jgi:hypothetical protein
MKTIHVITLIILTLLIFLFLRICEVGKETLQRDTVAVQLDDSNVDVVYKELNKI